MPPVFGTMEQELETIGAPEGAQPGMLANQSFAGLLELARGYITSNELRTYLGMSSSEFGRLLSTLYRDRLVSVDSEADGRAGKQTLRLTEKGESVLLHEMEQMCELPEK